jgi:hypothetical protein
MITLHNAIRVLNPNIVTIRGDIAYDANEQEVFYDKSAVEVKLIQLQAEEVTKQQAEITTKESALSKLTALGLTADEVKAILGVA